MPTYKLINDVVGEMLMRAYLNTTLTIANENGPASFLVTKNPTSIMFSDFITGALGILRPRNDA